MFQKTLDMVKEVRSANIKGMIGKLELAIIKHFSKASGESLRYVIYFLVFLFHSCGGWPILLRINSAVNLESGNDKAYGRIMFLIHSCHTLTFSTLESMLIVKVNWR